MNKIITYNATLSGKGEENMKTDVSELKTAMNVSYETFKEAEDAYWKAHKSANRAKCVLTYAKESEIKKREEYDCAVDNYEAARKAYLARL